MFSRLFNADTLASLEIRLEPCAEEELLDALFLTLQDRLRKAVDARLGHEVVSELEHYPDTLRKLLPDWYELLHIECLKLFREVEAHAKEIQRGEWSVAA